MSQSGWWFNLSHLAESRGQRMTVKGYVPTLDEGLTSPYTWRRISVSQFGWCSNLSRQSNISWNHKPVKSESTVAQWKSGSRRHQLEGNAKLHFSTVFLRYIDGEYPSGAVFNTTTKSEKHYFREGAFGLFETWKTVVTSLTMTATLNQSIYCEKVSDELDLSEERECSRENTIQVSPGTTWSSLLSLNFQGQKQKLAKMPTDWQRPSLNKSQRASKSKNPRDLKKRGNQYCSTEKLRRLEQLWTTSRHP